MSKWLNQFLENMPGTHIDKSDSWNPKLDLSLLSPPSMGVLGKNLGNMPSTPSDKSDNWNPNPDLSLLSLPTMAVLGKNLGNMPGAHSDKSDNWNPKPDLSLLSPLTMGVLGKNLGNMSGTFSDKSDNRDSNMASSFYDFEERIAIAEIDGNQNPKEAHRIAYLDAFISLLSALVKDAPHQDWLAQKIQTAIAALEVQNFPTLN